MAASNSICVLVFLVLLQVSYSSYQNVSNFELVLIIYHLEVMFEMEQDREKLILP